MLNTTPNTVKTIPIDVLVRIMRDHGVDAWPQENGILAVDVWTKDGSTFSELVMVDAKLKAVRIFLGY